MSVDVVLFDLDGTLVDTVADITAALNQTLQEYARPPVAVEAIRPLVSGGSAAMLAHGLGERHPDFSGAQARFLQNYALCADVNSVLFPGIAEILDAIERKALRWGIVTNKHTRSSMPLLDKLGLRQRAACVVCGDTTAHPKPHPAPLLYACEHVPCVPEQALYVGDSRRDVDAAIAAGIRVLVAAYGYVGDEDVSTWGADAVLTRPADVLDYL